MYKLIIMGKDQGLLLCKNIGAVRFRQDSVMTRFSVDFVTS